MLELSLNLSFLRLALVLVEHKLLAAGGLERLPYVKLVLRGLIFTLTTPLREMPVVSVRL